MRTGSLGRNSRLGCELLDLIASQSVLNLIRGNGKVLSRAYPRTDQAAETFVVKLLHQPGKPAGLVVDHLHHARSQWVRATRENAAQFLTSHIFQKTHNSSPRHLPSTIA